MSGPTDARLLASYDLVLQHTRAVLDELAQGMERNELADAAGSVRRALAQIEDAWADISLRRVAQAASAADAPAQR